MGGRPSEAWERARARVGTTIKGKYRIDDVIGVGGMSSVYRATHRNQAKFAIKVLLPELSFREDIRSRFLREGYAANTVDHPGVVLVVDDDVAEDGAAFLVMELLRGRGVEAVCADHQRRLPALAAIAILDQLLDVLEAAHRKGIIHRDIKPANLFLTDEGTVKVLDFGIARVKDAMASNAQGTSTGVLLGTPAFMAPEQARAISSEIDAQTDVWAAGATLFTLISGELVHAGESAAMLLIKTATEPARSLSSVIDVPAPIAAVVDRALMFDKRARWPSAAAAREALRAACKTVFGVLPSREVLRQLITTSEPASFVQQHTVAVTAPYHPPHVGGTTTAQPVSNRGAAPSRRARTRGVPYWPIAIAVVAIAAIGFGVRARLARNTQSAVAKATPSLAPTTSAPVSSAEERSVPIIVASAEPSTNSNAPSMSSAPLLAPPKAATLAVAKAAPSVAASASARPDDAPARSFDRDSALTAFKRSAAAVGACRSPDAPDVIPRFPVDVKVTFAPAGNAATIDVAPPLAGTALGQCVVRALHSVSVPPFDGAPVTVGKRFTFE